MKTLRNLVILMKIKSSIAIALVSLVLSLAASADVVSQAYEVALSDFRAPASANGAAAFRACGGCEQKLVRVTESTRYAVNGKTVQLIDFRKAISQARNRSNIPVIVLHHLESDTIESVSVSL